MKVYVSERPKSCLDCKCCGGDYLNFFCNFTEDEVVNYDSVCKNCPLQSLSDYTKQVRKEVVQEIKRKLQQAKLIYEWKGEETTIEDILDQIQN